MTKPRETFHSNPSIQIKGDWMFGLTDLEVCNSIFNINTTNKKFEIYKLPGQKIGGVSYEKVRDEIERDLDISDITATDLQDDIIPMILIAEYRKQVTKRLEDAKYMDILALYHRSVFQDFESFVRTEFDLEEDDIRLVLDENNSIFITYELEPGIYTFKDLSEALYNNLKPKDGEFNNSVVIEFNDITMKTKLVVRAGIIAINIDQKSFFSTVLGFNHGWDFKHFNENISQKIVNLSTTNELHLKCDVIDGSVVNGLRQPKLLVLF